MLKKGDLVMFNDSAVPPESISNFNGKGDSIIYWTFGIIVSPRWPKTRRSPDYNVYIQKLNKVYWFSEAEFKLVSEA